MKLRLTLLALLLGLRLVLGGLATSSCPPGRVVKLVGKVDYATQRGSERIIHIGGYYAKSSESNWVYSGDTVEILGTCRRQVIDFWLSRTELHSAQILTYSTPDIGHKSGFWQSLRTGLSATYKRQLPEPEAGLVSGIVLGAKTNLSESFYKQLIDSGTVQIVVASGYNLGLVAVFISSFTWWFFGKRIAFLLSAVALTLYTLLTGAEPPVTRALVMVLLVLGAPLLGRRVRAWYVYSLALWLILMWDPAMLVSVSFQLSAAATAGLIFLSPRINQLMDRLKLKTILGALSADLSSTFAAQIATLPIIFWHFGRVSWVAPLANVLLAPLIGPLTLAGVLSLPEAVILPYGGIVSLSTLVLSKLVVGIIKLFS